MKKRLIEVELQDGEAWWGGNIEDEIIMPFSGAYSRNLAADSRQNQAVPLLVSSKGRFIWSEEPIAIHFENNRITVASDEGEVAISEGHGNLREAFRMAAKTYFPASGAIPEELFFTKPQYNLWIELQYEPTQEKVLA